MARPGAARLGHSDLSEGLFGQTLARASQVFEGGGWQSLPHRTERLRQFQRITRETVSPLEYLENALHPWVGFVTMALFIASLALHGSHLDTAKVGVLAGSLASAVVGMALLTACTSGDPSAQTKKSSQTT